MRKEPGKKYNQPVSDRHDGHIDEFECTFSHKEVFHRIKWLLRLNRNDNSEEPFVYTRFKATRMNNSKKNVKKILFHILRYDKDDYSDELHRPRSVI